MLPNHCIDGHTSEYGYFFIPFASPFMFKLMSGHDENLLYFVSNNNFFVSFSLFPSLCMRSRSCGRYTRRKFFSCGFFALLREFISPLLLFFFSRISGFVVVSKMLLLVPVFFFSRSILKCQTFSLCFSRRGKRTTLPFPGCKMCYQVPVICQVRYPVRCSVYCRYCAFSVII